MPEEIPHTIYFILLLAGLFATATAVVLTCHFRKVRRRRRLVSPRKDYIHRLPGMIRIFTRAALCICCACGLWGCPRQHAASAAAGSAPQHPQDFKLPHIPAALTTPEARADYLAAHYWDNFDFRDTTLISRPEITEQAFADFIDLLTAAPISAADSALVRMMEASTANSAMFAHFTELSEKYLYDPNSPLRNEELYIPVLQYLTDSPHLDSLSKLRPRYQLELALKNRPGDIAADFYYTSESGKRSRMRQIEADYTILFFNNPDCGDCNRVKEYMDMSPVIGGRLREQAGRPKREPAPRQAENSPYWRFTQKGTFPIGETRNILPG